MVEARVVIEVPFGSRNSYRLDQRTGLLQLERTFEGAVYCPVNAGVIPQTRGRDNEPVRVFIPGRVPILPLTLVDVSPIGVLVQTHESGPVSERLIAVNLGDAQFNHYRDVHDLPAHVIRELRRFWTDADPDVGSVGEPGGADDAQLALREAIERYRGGHGRTKK